MPDRCRCPGKLTVSREEFAKLLLHAGAAAVAKGAVTSRVTHLVCEDCASTRGKLAASPRASATPCPFIVAQTHHPDHKTSLRVFASAGSSKGKGRSWS